MQIFFKNLDIALIRTTQPKWGTTDGIERYRQLPFPLLPFYTMLLGFKILVDLLHSF